MSEQDLCMQTVKTRMGWIALVGCDGVLVRLTIGHPTEIAALRAISQVYPTQPELAPWNPELADQLQAFAAGKPVNFSDVSIDLSHLTPFARQVIRRCRKIARGRTLSYGELATAAGSPRPPAPWATSCRKTATLGSSLPPRHWQRRSPRRLFCTARHEAQTAALRYGSRVGCFVGPHPVRRVF